MTHKFQYSKKFDDGTIIVVGGDSLEEFETNYNAFKASELARVIWQDVKETSKPQQAGAAPVPTQEQQFTYETWDAEILSVESYNEQKRYKVKGDKWMKYGVTVWPEVLTEAGFDLDGLAIGQDYQLTHTAKCQMLDGKPKKIVELTSVV